MQFMNMAVPDGAKLLFGINLALHFHMETMELARKNKIYFCMLPVNATHLFQPLDVFVSAPMKSTWRKE